MNIMMKRGDLFNKVIKVERDNTNKREKHRERERVRERGGERETDKQREDTRELEREKYGKERERDIFIITDTCMEKLPTIILESKSQVC